MGTEGVPLMWVKDRRIPIVPLRALASRVTDSGMLSVNLAVALFGLSGVIGRATALSAPLITLGRVLFGTVSLVVATRVLHLPVRMPARVALPLAGQGALLALHWSLFFESINVGGVAIGLLTFATFPLFTAAIEPVLLHTRPTRLQMAAALVILGGLYILVPSFSLESSVVRGVVWGLGSAASFALLSVINRRLGEVHTSAVISLYQFATAAVLLSPVLIWDHPARLLQPSVVLLMVLLGTCCTALALTLFIAALQHMSAMRASVFASLEPVWGIACAAVLLGEIPSLRSIAGGVVILAASAAAGLRPGPTVIG